MKKKDSRPFIIGIAGGSGSGKTTLASALKKNFGRKASILSMDNYQKFGQKLPLVEGMKNRDCPSAVDWQKFISDIRKLRKGESVTVRCREQKNLTSPKTVTFHPQSILIIEGYLLFHLASVRKLMDILIFTDAKDATRIKRRTKFKNDAYLEKVLLPMHHRYIEPTKKHANLVLNTERLSLKECLSLVKKKINKMPQP